ncbi:peptidase [Carboxylicivirga sp. A043]|uniref:S28 family serine protease n=1 Tax=Carboxylicivirga litoralis TaxID=2816963 RepID=UPI0021CB8890|nr:S28 family serine protease [Carboxylicivirga sp. A043]MCU4154690.1 peptidase [Carboxylicivirga sp. A043]
MKKTLFSLMVSMLLIAACQKPISTPEELFNLSSSIDFEEITTDTSLYEQSWLIYFTQPLDHSAPAKGTFKQRIWLSHKNIHSPTVCVTEGYAAHRNYTSELARLTESNQLIIEHRYFAQSCPDSLDWQYLTVEQAAADHHRIIQFFKKLYQQKWVTTGISKGGQTAIFHRALYPNDVDLSVPYVAPINLEREDNRLFSFFKQVGSSDERQKIFNFQKSVFEKRSEILPLFKSYALDKGYTFRMGYDKAFEIVVLEYPFSFWQWGNQIDQIPTPNATANELFEHLKKGSDIGYVSDQSWNDIKPFFYQAYKELGYYAYVPGELSKYIKAFDKDTISSNMFAPGGDTLKFIPTMPMIMTKLSESNPQIIAIIGQKDPWGATSINNEHLSNTIRAIDPNGSHLTRIKTLPKPVQEDVIKRIKELLTSE